MKRIKEIPESPLAGQMFDRAAFSLLAFILDSAIQPT
jgi:hypothetical protein